MAAVVLPLFAQAEATESELAVIDPSQRYQQLEGWGSSLCWWAAQVGNWDEKKVDEIVDLITSPDKLNMNIFRYNIGGGDDPAHADGHMVKGKGKRAEMEGFKDSPTAPYNWEADKGQRTILLKIKEKRPDAVFEAFSNSAPYWMTYSGCAAGNADPLKDNLKPEYYEMFCDYLLDVCKHYKTAYQIDFKTLEPFNESFSDYWYAEGSQEGCHFEPESQMKIIRMLYPKLKATGLNTVLSASDETNLRQFLTVQKSYQAAGDIWDKLGQLNTHTYSGTNAEREEVRRLVRQSGKPFWQSETGPSKGQGLESPEAIRRHADHAPASLARLAADGRGQQRMVRSARQFQDTGIQGDQEPVCPHANHPLLQTRLHLYRNGERRDACRPLSYGKRIGHRRSEHDRLGASFRHRPEQALRQNRFR